MLTQDKIQKLAARKNVKAVAVTNFLSTIGGLSQTDALLNLQMDARLYRWNAATQAAIRKGITDHFKPAPVKGERELVKARDAAYLNGDRQKTSELNVALERVRRDGR